LQDKFLVAPITLSRGVPVDLMAYLRATIRLRVKGSAGRGPPAAAGSEGAEYATASDRLTPGLRIPVRSCQEKVSSVSAPHSPPAAKGFTGVFEKAPDFVLEMNSAMRMVSMGTMGDMGHSMGGTGRSMEGMGSTGNTVTSVMRWAVNGASYPDTEPLFVSQGSVVKVRFVDRDTPMMHPRDHAMHLHSAAFLIASENEARPAGKIWKDTANVPAGRSVDVAFVVRNPVAWMLHCHFIEYEDGGMMTMVKAE
jgi:FtsP/CotA-like multicopper oxidase with cupredoxin domain